MLKKLKIKFIIWFMQTWLYRKIMFKLLPSIRFSTGYTLIRGWHYYLMYQVLQPGDWVLIIDYASATGMMLRVVTRGQFSHAAVCVDIDSVWEISEMLGDGYTKSTFYDLCRESDRVVIIDKEEWSDEYRKEMVALCKSDRFQEASYDLQFEMEKDSEVYEEEFGHLIFACSELCYFTDFKHTVDVNLTDVAGIGRPYISPQGLYNGKGIRVKADSSLLEKPEELF